MGSGLPTAQMGVHFAHFQCLSLWQYVTRSLCDGVCVLASGQVTVYSHLSMEPQGCNPLLCHSASVIKGAITTKEQQAQKKEIIGEKGNHFAELQTQNMGLLALQRN